MSRSFSISVALLALAAVACSSPVARESEHAGELRSNACTPTSARSAPIELSVLPEAGDAPFVDEIEKATESIHVFIYMMGTEGVFDALKAKAEAGVDVRVIFDGMHERAFNQAAFDGLEAAGAQVKWSDPKFPFMHAKTFVVDGKTSVISTGNYPAKLIAHERNYVALDHDLADARTISAVFDADWNGTTPSITCTRLLVSPVNSKERVLDLVESAVKTLHIESLELADADVIAKIVAKKEAGLDVKVLLADPAWNSTNQNAETAKELLAHGIPTKWIPKATMLVHVKSILVDGKRAYMGSENLTGTSLEHNREMGLVVTDSAPLKTMAATFAKDFEGARPFDS